jgi:hypothetical protein
VILYGSIVSKITVFSGPANSGWHDKIPLFCRDYCRSTIFYPAMSFSFIFELKTHCMLHSRPLVLAALLLVLSTAFVNAQDKRLVSGSVTDAATGEPVPFATVSLRKQLIGIVTNEEGKFDFYIPAESDNDTLMIGFFGYKPRLMALSSITGFVQVKLDQNAMELQEVVVRPLKPQEYIRMAMRRVKINYASEPFGTDAYYREKAIENGKLLKLDEGVFRTYYPKYQDTVKNQHQLMLFARAQNTSEVAFMKAEREKKAEKEKKTGKKQDDKVEIDLTSSFGGPENSLRAASLTDKNTENCLDTLHLKKYNYAFAKSTTYNNKELLVIEFDTKGKVDHVREEGRIYIDLATFAIVKLERKGDFVIPFILRPILFLYGFGISNPKFESNLEFQQLKNKWYPKNIWYNIEIELTNKHWFKPDEHSRFEIESVFTVNKTRIEQAAAIPVAKRFKSNKDMKDQVFNDEGLTWEGINIIKK